LSEKALGMPGAVVVIDLFAKAAEAWGQTLPEKVKEVVGICRRSVDIRPIDIGVDRVDRGARAGLDEGRRRTRGGDDAIGEDNRGSMAAGLEGHKLWIQVERGTNGLPDGPPRTPIDRRRVSVILPIVRKGAEGNYDAERKDRRLASSMTAKLGEAPLRRSKRP
jgi:hypothetical protein